MPKPHALFLRCLYIHRRRRSQFVGCVAPSGLLGQLAGHDMTGDVVGTQQTGEPARSLRIDLAESDLPDRCMQP